MGPRFALRWTLIGLVSALVLVAAAVALRLARPVPAPPPARVYSVDDLLSATEMRFDVDGVGTQIISGTILTLKLAPYPPRSAVTSTVTLVALTSDGKPAETANPTLTIAPSGQAASQTFPLAHQTGGIYEATGILFPTAGSWHMRVDVYLGDDIPSSMLMTVNAR
ncbi:MAG: hypothetical protein M1434_09095 [Chloroflexi bacterium]|nr:hypothetical protein [Chloroflexota bacterium]MCL5274882.1 hypothetical protein [Chloroflexota bacterium]